MIITEGDCIPVRTIENQWATYCGRVIGYDTEKMALVVVNRDGKCNDRKLVVHVIEPTKNWWKEIGSVDKDNLPRFPHKNGKH